MIVFFKLNLNLVKKIFRAKKREEQMKYKKIMENKRNTILYNKKEIVEDLNLPPPLFLEFVELRKKYKLNVAGKNFDKFHEFEKIKTNAIQKNKRNQKLLSNITETNSLGSSKKLISDKNNETTN